MVFFAVRSVDPATQNRLPAVTQWTETSRPRTVRNNLKIGLTSRQEARKRRIASNVKPFIGTLRVTNPVRQSRASSRKRVLRGDG